MQKLPLLPVKFDFDTTAILKQLVSTHKVLAELKGITDSIPNKEILISTLNLQEAKDSSEIENIITTHDEMYKQKIGINEPRAATKEVKYYERALSLGFEMLKENGFISNKMILCIQEELEQNNAGFRKLLGTVLKNDKTDEIIYTPPQDYDSIISLMSNLEQFINNDEGNNLDPLVIMAIIHYQFESIHPFYDGNGRTGRIINILYLVKCKLLNYPILYLSRYINKYKQEYYEGLQNVRTTNDWENWVLYMLQAIEETAVGTTKIIKVLNKKRNDLNRHIKDNYKFHSQELINHLFKYPYTKVRFLENDISVSRITATNYLDQLTKGGVLRKEKIGRSNIYINIQLFEVLANIDRYE